MLDAKNNPRPPPVPRGQRKRAPTVSEQFPELAEAMAQVHEEINVFDDFNDLDIDDPSY